MVPRARLRFVHSKPRSSCSSARDHPRPTLHWAPGPPIKLLSLSRQSCERAYLPPPSYTKTQITMRCGSVEGQCVGTLRRGASVWHRLPQILGGQVAGGLPGLGEARPLTAGAGPVPVALSTLCSPWIRWGRCHPGAPAVRRNHAARSARHLFGRHHARCRDRPGDHTGSPLPNDGRDCRWLGTERENTTPLSAIVFSLRYPVSRPTLPETATPAPTRTPSPGAPRSCRARRPGCGRRSRRPRPGSRR
jgi:hypothetical protein